MVRRRRRRQSVVCLFCALCCILFVLANLLLIHGFSLHDVTAFVEDTPKASVPLHGPPSLQRELLPPAKSLYLPIAAINFENKIRKLMDSDDYQSYEQTFKQWNTSSSNDLIHITASDLRRILTSTSECKNVNQLNLTRQTFLASGWTKAVYRGQLDDKKVAIKTVDAEGHDVSMCQQHYLLSEQQCYSRAAHKVLKEMVLLRGLQHPHVVEVVAHCVPDGPFSKEADSRVALVTELGETLDLIKLLQMSWEDRLRVSYGLTKLLFFLAHSPYGPLVLNDFRHQQFVLVGGEIKLTDMDDVGFQQPSCISDEHCQQYFSSSNFTIRTQCVSGHCEGFNEKKNMHNAARHFTNFLLPHGAPPSLRPQIDPLVQAYSNASWDIGKVLQHLSEVLEAYISGAYLHRQLGNEVTTYEFLAHKDLPGLHDYRCQYSMASSGCTVSVFDQKEAEDFCDADQLCKAFVMSDQKTWTGRRLVHLKKGVSLPSPSSKTDLYVKPSYKLSS